ncbi:MAG: hypothetical protein IPG71_09595 [bacterium]|nr:hypothetical protein [bacterium]
MKKGTQKTMNEIREIHEAAIKFAEENLTLWARHGNPPDEEDDSSTVKKTGNTVSRIVAKLKGLKSAEWSQINYSTIMACRNNKNIGKAVKIRGTFKRLDEDAPVSTGNSMADILRFEFQDERGDVLRTTRITDSRLQKDVQEFFGEYLSLDFYGTIIPEWQGLNAKNKWLYRFFLIHVHPSEDPLSMVQATREEIAEAEKTVSAHKENDGDLLSYIGTKLVEAIRIKGLDEAPQLEQALRFALFQSLSDGYSSNGKISYKLHSLVIGSPAVGKKLLSEAASLLNPVSKEAHPSKITRAGIVGAATNTSGQWKSDPGLIPLAHRGVFIVQDFHHVKNKGDLMGVFSMVMEDGLVIDATAAKQAHHALTSIHIDTNRLSHLHANDSSPQSPTDQLLDVGITMNVLSRFDFIIEIPRNTARQLEIALEMHSEPVICVSRPDSGSANKLAET